jgi:uncharacterized protein YjlB
MAAMPLKDQIKNYARKLIETEPDAAALARMLRQRKPFTYRFEDDGIVPNHPEWPVIVYRRPVVVPAGGDPARIMDAVFAANGWGRSWRDTVYDYVHYHSQVHEVLGVATGAARLECGGIKGYILALNPGDVVILPAGTGHRIIEACKDFLVVGAYPPHGTYDECTDTRERPEARKRIAKVRKPQTDPVYGAGGPLMRLWEAPAKPAR